MVDAGRRAESAAASGMAVRPIHDLDRMIIQWSLIYEPRPLRLMAGKRTIIIVY